MTDRLHPTSRVAVALTALGALYLACIAIAQSSILQEQPTAVSAGLLFDLTVTAGAIGYFLLVRPGTLPGAALIPLVLVGLFTASRILPGDQRAVLVAVGLIWAAAELAVLGVVIVQSRRIVRTTRAALGRGKAPWPALAAGLGEILGQSLGAAMLAQESIVTWYALTGWFRRPRAADSVTVFSHHRSHAWGAVVLVLVLISVPEALGVHYLLLHRSVAAAVIVSIVHAYGLLWLLGDYQYMRHTAIVLAPDGMLHIDIGFRLHLAVPLDDIAAIGSTRDLITNAEHVLEDAEHVLEARVMDEPNVFVRLRAPRTASVLLGRRRPVSGLAMRVDDPDALIRAVVARKDPRS